MTNTSRQLKMKRTRSYLLGLLLLAGLLLGCSPGENLAEASAIPTPTVRVDYSCNPGVLLTAAYNLEDLSSYIVHHWNYIDHSEEGSRELYEEEVTAVKLENGKVADTDSVVTNSFNELQKIDSVRVNGEVYVRQNEGAWEKIMPFEWGITVDGLMGDSPAGFYSNLSKVSWGHPDWVRGSDFTPGDPYCETTQIDFNGRSAWRFTFHDVPEWLFQTGFGSGRRGSTSRFQEVLDKLIQSGWAYQSVDYSATVTDLTSSPQLVAESMSERFSNGSGNNLYIIWETELSNFNEPVMIRQPQQ